MAASQVGKRQVPVVAYTRKVRRQQAIAKGMLWIAAGVTIAILVVIIGYIVFRGFVADVRQEYPVIAEGSTTVSLSWQGEDQVVFIVHRGVRTADLAMPQVIDLLSGESRDWEVAAQDLKVRVFSYSPAHPLGKAVNTSVIAVSQEKALARNTVIVADEREMAERVAQTPGAIGYLPAGSPLLGSKGIKPLSVRNIALVASPGVLEIKDNLRLRFVTEEAVRNIFRGRHSNWRQVGGTDLPLEMVSFYPKMHLAEEYQRLMGAQLGTISGEARFVRSLDELFQTLRERPGAVGYCYYADAVRLAPEQIVGVERHTVSLNMSLPFLIEAPSKSGRVGGISTIIGNTLFMIALTLLFSTPLGVLAALYLTEYARQGKLLAVLRYSTETLAGIPSIIFGLFGYIVFVSLFKLGIGLLSGTLTLTIMILPTIIRTSEEAFKAVPMSFREGSLALGATKWQTMTGVVIPAASPGILTGVILAIGRAVGETAALLFTMGSSYGLATSLKNSARVLSLHLYILVKEGISFERAFATGTILIVIVLLVNFTTTRLIGRMNKLR